MNKFKLYNGEVILEYNDDKHKYSVDGVEVAGVTSVTGVLDKPALVWWSANMGAEYLLENLKPGQMLDELEIKDLATGVKFAHRKRGSKAADIGTMVHNWIEDFIRAGLAKKPLPKMPVNKEMRRSIEAFLAWTKENEVKFLNTERIVYSKKYGYAGTLDAEVMINGKYSVVDFKTSKAIYDEMFLQVSAYAHAVMEEDGKKDAQLYILRLPKVAPQGNDSPFEARKVDHSDELFKVFLSCLNIQRWKRETKRSQIAKEINEGITENGNGTRSTTRAKVGTGKPAN